MTYMTITFQTFIGFANEDFPVTVKATINNDDTVALNEVIPESGSLLRLTAKDNSILSILDRDTVDELSAQTLDHVNFLELGSDTEQDLAHGDTASDYFP